MIIIQDTREQHPFEFHHPVKRETLSCGDYSIAGLVDVVRMERKGVAEIWQMCGSKQEFFKNQLERLAKYPVRLLIVEGSISELSKRQKYSQMVWQNVAYRLMRWTVRLGIPVWFLGERSDASVLLVEDLLSAIHDLYRKERGFVDNWKGLLNEKTE